MTDNLSSSTPMPRQKDYSALFAVLLSVIIVCVYWQVGEHHFLSFDDNSYVTQNAHVTKGLTLEGLRWALTSFDASNWHPLTWLSHMLDVELFGVNSRWHHLSNVVYHLVASVLVLVLFNQVTGMQWRSFAVAAMFALHPMHVESVAWVAERKDLLSAIFGVLSLLSYCRFTHSKSKPLYATSLIMFSLSLMSKPMLVTMPLLILLLDYWPLKRFDAFEGNSSVSLTRIIGEKIPYAVLSILSGIITIIAQDNGNAIAKFSDVPLHLRIGNAVISYVTYIIKLIIPVNLAIYYPFPLEIPVWKAVAAIVLIMIITSVAFVARKHSPYILTGWLWFLISLLPVIGIIKVGDQAMADRYSYVPSIGLFLLVTWSFAEVSQRICFRKTLATLTLFLIIASMCYMTSRQIGYWQDSYSVYSHSLQVAPGSDIIHNNLGIVLRENNDIDGAIRHFLHAINLSPNYVEAHKNIALALLAKGNIEVAIRAFKRAIELDNNDYIMHYYLGLAYEQNNNLSSAIEAYNNALKINPYHLASIDRINELSGLRKSTRGYQ